MIGACSSSSKLSWPASSNFDGAAKNYSILKFSSVDTQATWWCVKVSFSVNSFIYRISKTRLSTVHWKQSAQSTCSSEERCKTWEITTICSRSIRTYLHYLQKKPHHVVTKQSVLNTLNSCYYWTLWHICWCIYEPFVDTPDQQTDMLLLLGT